MYIMTKPVKKQKSITLDIVVIEEIKLLAKENDRTVSGYINHVLKEHICQVKNK